MIELETRWGVEPGGAKSEGAEFGGAEPRGATSSGGPAGASPRLSPRPEPLSPQQLREWLVRRARLRSGAAGAGAIGDTRARGAGVTNGSGGPGGTRTRGTGVAGTGGVGGVGAGDPTEPGAAGAGGAGAGGTSAGGAGAGGAGAGSWCPPASPLPAPSPYSEQTGGLTERREPASHPASAVRTGPRVPHPRPPPVPGTHAMALRPSSVPQRVPLPAPPASSLRAIPDPASDRTLTASPTVSRLLATVTTDPCIESTVVSALVAELVEYAATALVAESASASPPSVGGEFSLGTNVLEDRQEEFECLAAAVPRFASMLLAPERDPDAPDIPTSRSYAEAITGSQWSLRRPAYGLRQAPRKGHDTLRTTLAALGFTPSIADPSLFLRTDTSLPLFYVLVYVDNLVFATADTEALTLVKSELQKRHTCTDLGELRSYLGLQITRDRARRTITLTHSHMVHQVLQRFGFQFSSAQPTPLSTSHSLSAPPSDDSVELSGPYTELTLLGLTTQLRSGRHRVTPSALVPALFPDATSLVAESESESVCPPSVGGECALSTDVLEDRQEEFQCFAAALPHLVSTLLAPEGDPDAPDIPTPRSYAEAIEGPYSSQWQAAMDAEMASWKSTGTYIDEVPPPGANIVSGMLIFRVKRPPGSPPVFKARYVARGFSQRQEVEYFQTFSPTPKMTTLWVLLHVAAQRDYELHSLDFSTAFLQGSLHEEIWLRHPPGFTGSFPAGTQWSLRQPVCGLRQAPREWHDTLRTTLAALGFAPSTADPSLFLRTDTSLPPFYILVYVDDLVFATAGLAHVKFELQKRHTCTDLGELRIYLGLQITRDRAPRTITLTKSHMVQQVLQRFDFTYSSPQATSLSTRHSLSALPSDESVEPSGPYPELVGCLMYLMTCTRPDLAYPLSILARYVAPGRHRPEHMAAAKRVLHYLCSTSGLGLVLGGRSPVVLTGHADASSCEAGIYAGAMAAQDLRWLTYLLTDLGEPPRSPPVLYVDNKAMLALCREHRLEHRTKHIALRYFLVRELQQRGQLRLAYVASQANTADIFTKALQPYDHQRFCTMLAGASGNDSVLVIVDRLTKMAHFPPCRTTITAEETTKLFISTVIRLHGLPSAIVSDRDPKFTSKFWQETWAQYGTRLQFSSSYHPQTDGQKEQTNQTMEQLIRRNCPDLTKWEDLLPVLEFAYNNASFATTNQSPFYLNYEIDPVVPSSTTPDNPVPRSQQFVSELQAARDKAAEFIRKANTVASRYADRQQRNLPFCDGQMVLLLDTKNLRLPQPAKLRPRYMGPFRIIRMLTPSSDIARPNIAPSVRPVADPRLQPWKILNRRICATPAGRHADFLLRWADCTCEDDTWVPVDSLQGHSVLRDYLSRLRVPDVDHLS
ncbi:unnamed protein product [Closterium sp. NIES-54]